MTAKTILRIEFLCSVAMALFVGVWLALTLQQYLTESLTYLWNGVTVFFVGALVFDVYRIWQKLR